MINELHRMRQRLMRREAEHWEASAAEGFTQRWRDEQRGRALGARQARHDVEALLTFIGEECP